MITITKQEWFEEWNEKLFTDGIPAIINFSQDKFPGVATEILESLNKVTGIQILNVDGREFKFLARVVRKHHGLNGFPNIVTVVNGEFDDYLFIKPFHESHPGSMSSDIDCMIYDFMDSIRKE